MLESFFLNPSVQLKQICSTVHVIQQIQQRVSVSQCTELVTRRWGAYRITTRFNLVFYACVIDLVTWVPGIPCCPGGPGSPCGPWIIMEIATAQLTLNTSLGVNICQHWFNICTSARMQLMRWDSVSQVETTDRWSCLLTYFNTILKFKQRN